MHLVGIAALCASLQLSGCTRGEGVPSDLPPPGEMRVISVEPISQGPSDLDNLVPNGNFSEWWAGAPAPTHFILPPPQFSTLERLVEGEDHFPCAQTWKQTDRKKGKDKRLHVFVPNIKADTEYEFSVEAQSEDGCTVLLDVYECDENREEFEILSFGEPVIPATATTPTWFTTRFKTQKGGQLAIYPGTVDEEVPPGRIIWYHWHVREANDSTKPPTLHTEAR